MKKFGIKAIFIVLVRFENCDRSGGCPVAYVDSWTANFVCNFFFDPEPIRSKMMAEMYLPSRMVDLCPTYHTRHIC